MEKSRFSRLIARRRLLENPYAHIEQLIDSSSTDDDSYYSVEGRLASFQSKSAKSKARTDEEIEQLVIDLQRDAWRQRFRLWPPGGPTSPIAMLDISKMSHLVGFNFELVDTLGTYSDLGEKIAIAGQIDWRDGAIRISQEFEPSVQRFTGAHEVGHALLHPDIELLHRDKALSGPTLSRNRIEREADKFAVYFLMPEKQIRKEFQKRFLTAHFSLTESSVFALFGKSMDGVADIIGQRRRLSRQLASSVNYNGKFFYSLAETFGVAVESVAIRLEELKLV